MENIEFAKMMVLVVPLGLFIVMVIGFLAFALGDLLLGAHANPWLP